MLLAIHSRYLESGLGMGAGNYMILNPPTKSDVQWSSPRESLQCLKKRNKIEGVPLHNVSNRPIDTLLYWRRSCLLHSISKTWEVHRLLRNPDLPPLTHTPVSYFPPSAIHKGLWWVCTCVCICGGGQWGKYYGDSTCTVPPSIWWGKCVSFLRG